MPQPHRVVLTLDCTAENHDAIVEALYATDFQLQEVDIVEIETSLITD